MIAEKLTFPEPRTGESPLDYAVLLGEHYVARSSAEHRKLHGQYFTPPEIARFMVSLASPRVARVLDAGAGTGILACAVVERHMQSRSDGPLHLECYERDPALMPALERSLDYARGACPGLTYRVHRADFAAEVLLRQSNLFESLSSDFDLAIGNPPYFKLPSRSDIVEAAKKRGVPGTSNIYSLMMRLAGNLLRAAGELVYVVPRGFCSGLYFKGFRTQLLGSFGLEHVHVFGSRSDPFRNHEVLQENVVVRLRKGPQPETVVLTESEGIADLRTITPQSFAARTVIDREAGWVIRLPVGEQEQLALAQVQRWPCTLGRLGLRVSTGPVVAFRSRSWLRQSDGDYPLIWLNHVRPMALEWPSDLAKPQYVRDCPESQPWLVPNSNYVVLRRFSAKEDRRRLIAAPLLREQFATDRLGLENHLNFIHRPHESLSCEEAIGLSALLNSPLLDCYFRAVNGNTQVNACDLRTLPLPEQETIVRLGRQILGGGPWEDAVAEELRSSGSPAEEVR